MPYSPKLVDAVAHALELHNHQSRKGSDVPYITHLFSVAALVGESGGDEDEVIAALLHDAVEDQGGAPALAEIRRRFGPRVADIVEGCTDTLETPKPPWRARKEAFLARLARAEPEVLRVTCADKLHNVRSTLSDLREHGDRVWGRFSGGREGTLWYHAALLDVLEERLDLPLVRELSHAVHDLLRFGEDEQRLRPPSR